MTDDLAGLLWDVCTKYCPTDRPLPTQFVTGEIARGMGLEPHTPPHNALVRECLALAKAGLPWATQGPPESRKMYGKLVTMRPWWWNKPACPRPVVVRCKECGQIIANKES